MHYRWIAAAVLAAAVGALAIPGVATAAPATHQPSVAGPHTVKTLNATWEREAVDYWCGPAATRIALSVRMNNPPDEGALANQLGTTVNGTDTINQVTGVLNQDLGTNYYETKQIPNDPPSQAQIDLLWSDVVTDVNNNYALVANIVAPPNNHPPGYPNTTIYHYFTVAGYNSDNQSVYIVDPASGLPGFEGVPNTYWLSLNELASLIPPKGYSA